MSSSKTQRLLDVISYLAGRRVPVALDDLMNAIPAYAKKWSADDERTRATVRRMFERDKDELREVGIPIETVDFSGRFDTEAGDGYRLARRDLYLPYLRVLERDATDSRPPSNGVETFDIAEEEIAAAIEGLRHLAVLPDFPFAREVRSALGKLAFDLDPEWFTSPAVRFLPPSGPRASRRTMETLSDAILRAKRLTFRYRGIRRDEVTKRCVDPYGLFFHGGRWYVAGHDHDRNDLRVFRTGRMESVEVNRSRATSPDFEPPADFDVGALERRAPWHLDRSDDEEPGPNCIRAEILFRHPLSRWAERNGFGQIVADRTAERGDGSAVRSFSVRDEDAFLRWVLGLAGDAEVVAPAKMRRKFRGMARAVANAHRVHEGEGADV